MCELNIPDCFNCPYEECTATSKDILRQWHYSKLQKVMDNPDRVQHTEGAHVIPVVIGSSYNGGVARRQARYNRTEKARERQRKYYASEKGQAAERRKRQKAIESGKNAERCKKYRERKKAEKDNQVNV